MPRPKNPLPKYRCHKPTGQAVVTISTANGRRDVYIGKYKSPESKVAYERLLAELRVAPIDAVVPFPAKTGLSVAEVLLAFMKYADGRYRDPDGKKTRELTEYRQCVKLIQQLYSHTPASEFGPLALKAIRQKMLDAGLARTLVNRRIGRVRRIFKWATSEELIPVAISQALATVGGLQKGRPGVREADPVKPVAEEDVRAVMPFVRPEVAAMIELQMLTGMRPGEVCRIRLCEMDTSGDVWLYRPRRHKNAHRGKPRVVPLGPRAQAVLKKYWPVSPVEYFFSPRRAVDTLHAARTANRKTPRYPSHMKRNSYKRVATPKRAPAERYTATSFGHLVAKGVERANAARREQNRLTLADGGAKLSPIAHWHPNQIRHTFGTEIRRRYGLEAAGAALGHSRMCTTEVYAERDVGLAITVAAEVG